MNLYISKCTESCFVLIYFNVVPLDVILHNNIYFSSTVEISPLPLNVIAMFSSIHEKQSPTQHGRKICCQASPSPRH